MRQAEEFVGPLTPNQNVVGVKGAVRANEGLEEVVGHDSDVVMLSEGSGRAFVKSPKCLW